MPAVNRAPNARGRAGLAARGRLARHTREDLSVRINTAKQKMLKGEVSYGYAIGLGSIVAAEAMANSGIDHILLDRQHGSWGEDSAIAALIAMHGGSAIPMARVSRNDYTMIGRLLALSAAWKC